MRVVASIDVAAPPAALWRHITDPESIASFFSGVTRWELAGERDTGVGARYRMLLRVGSVEIGGLIEVVEWDELRDLAWTSVLGVDQRGRWRLRARGSGGTHVELRLSYGVAGAGLLGWLAEQASAPAMRRHLKRSVLELKRRVEQEQLVEQTARRRKRARAA